MITRLTALFVSIMVLQGNNLPDDNVVKEPMAEAHNQHNTFLEQKVKK